MYSIIPPGTHEVRVKKFFSQFQSNHTVSSAQFKPCPSIFVCFTNRCGSTLVSSLLYKMGLCGKSNKYKNYEYFNHDFVADFSKENNIFDLKSFSKKVVLEFLNPSGYFTSKIAIDQLFWITKDRIIGEILCSPIFIYVKRKNIVAQAISLSIAMQTGKWTSLHDSNSSSNLIFDPDKILENMLLISKMNSMFDLYFSLHSIDPIVIYYEDLINNIDILKIVLEKKIHKNLPYTYQSSLRLEKQATDVNLSWEDKIRSMYTINGSSDYSLNI